MPQMNKGGKFIFGMSVIREDGSIQFPTQTVELRQQPSSVLCFLENY